MGRKVTFRSLFTIKGAREVDVRTMKCIMKFIIQVTLIFREWGLVLILGSHNGQCTVHNAARNPTGMMTTEPDDEHYAVHNPAHESPQSEHYAVHYEPQRILQCIFSDLTTGRTCT